MFTSDLPATTYVLSIIKCFSLTKWKKI